MGLLTGPNPSQRPFPLPSLPKSIRRQIYECLPVCTRHVPGYRDDSDDNIYKDKPVVILVLRYVERAIVQTYRQLAAEAEPVLEIKTMKLGPPRLIASVEYLKRITHDLQFLHRMQDDASWPRLRISKQDLANKTLETQKILMWARILQLNLLSEKYICIGVFVGKRAQESGGRQLLDNLAMQLEQTMALQWWCKDCRHTRPMSQVGVEWKCVMVKDATWPALPPGCIMEAITWNRGKQREDYGVYGFGQLCREDEEQWKNGVKFPKWRA
ncbi:uncharacterized protein CC84DRAFT_1255299 [Paraphaeosphaeria sporulosa]|uniref:Uncharacterized protein n=1 Tax=Paraphaeosphaeria sporulosa TaxID=1460663 RepID=A0A177CNR9_9PLEO|nr:uncharacterized protein CC84DRAFT_1255299 [Paraphaeosphaeria sporulosa]OAG09185.1 hypothetical protein CC84DRAFT_1255299 [Paraphaeosphaeria sporulosa]